MLITCILKTFLGNRESKYLGAIPDSQTIVRSVDGRSVGRSVGRLVGGWNIPASDTTAINSAPN